MTARDFIKSVMDYYGAFENQAIAIKISELASRVRPKDLERIFDWLTENIAANWKVDVKAFTEARIALQVPFLEPTKTCACCGNVYTVKNLICPVCLYDPVSSGNVDEYRAFFREWQADKENCTSSKRIAEIIKTLQEGKTLKQ